MKIPVPGLIVLAAGLCAAALSSSCGSAPVDQQPMPLEQAPLAAPVIIELESDKVVSGPPAGIFVTWTRSESDRAVGYYLYRDTEPIPDPPIGETLPPGLRVNEGNQIAHPPSGESVTFNDLFDVVIGETYYYRVTVVDDDGLESDPSNEMSWTVAGHTVSDFSPKVTFWTQQVDITGDTFGVYDELTDSVQIQSIFGGGIQASILNWTDTTISFEVPMLAQTGPIAVIVDGTIALSDEDLVIVNPYILSVEPSTGNLGDSITVTGGNFGPSPATNTLSRGGVDISSAVTAWSDTEITFDLPTGDYFGELTVANEEIPIPSNSMELWLMPEILSTDIAAPQEGETIVLSGTSFTDSTHTEPSVLLNGVEPLVVANADSDSIEVSIAGEPGEHFVRLVHGDGSIYFSNDFPLTIAEPLVIDLAGIVSGTVYRPDAPPEAVVTTAADAELVELLVDGSIVGSSNTTPFSGLVLPVATLTNGLHTVQLRVQRRSVEAFSAVIDVTVYSLVGDVDASGVVDALDGDALKPLVGLSSLDTEYRIWYDTDEDGDVTEKDLAAVGYGFGDAL